MKRYLQVYLSAREELDRKTQELIIQKEILIEQSPTSHEFLKKPLEKIRKFKAGKIRIYYALSTERPDLWERIYGSPPQEPEILFLYVALRDDKTYSELYKVLIRQGLL